MLKNLGGVGLNYGRNGERDFVSRGSHNNTTQASVKVTASFSGGGVMPTGSRSGPSTTSAIRGNFELPLLQGFINETNLPSIRAICRDMYKYDAIAGGVVDLISTLPWSEVILTGLKSAKATEKYQESVNALNIKSAFPEITIEHLVNGVFIADAVWDDSSRTFTGLAPQDVEQCVLQPVPVYGHDPLISVNIPPSYKQLLEAANKDPRAKAVVDSMGPDFRKEVLKGVKELDPERAIYIPRRALASQMFGTPYLQRIIPLFLMEKALMRGTIESAYRRQKPVTHILAGDEEWIPDNQQLNNIASHFLQADQDPVSAIIATRPSIMVTEILSPTGFWRWDESNQALTDHKLKALGVSDTFLSGDVNLNTMDTALSVFIERVSYLRWTITEQTFYRKIFPYIAQANGFKADGTNVNRIQGSVGSRSEKLFKAQYGEFACVAGENFVGADNFNPNKWMMPKVQYLKQLKPEADSAYMDILDKMKEAGIPVPLRAYAAAAGFSVGEIVAQSEDDIKLREVFKEIMDQWPKTASDDGGGGMFGEGGNEEEASIRTNKDYIKHVIKAVKKKQGTFKRKGLFNRDYGDLALHRDEASNKVLSRKGQDYVDEKRHKTITEALLRIAARNNAPIKQASREKQKMFASYSPDTYIPGAKKPSKK